MVKRYLTRICIIFGLFLLSSCTEPEPHNLNPWPQPTRSLPPQPQSEQILNDHRIPSLVVQYTINGTTNDESMRGSRSSPWIINYDDGTSITLHRDYAEWLPLDLAQHEPIIERADNDIKLVFIFEHPVELTTGTRRWSIAYIGQGERYRRNYELIDVSDSTLFISSEEDGYVIEIHGIVPGQGNVTYVFSVK